MYYVIHLQCISESITISEFITWERIYATAVRVHLIHLQCISEFITISEFKTVSEIIATSEFITWERIYATVVLSCYYFDSELCWHNYCSMLNTIISPGRTKHVCNLR